MLRLVTTIIQAVLANSLKFLTEQMVLFVGALIFASNSLSSSCNICLKVENAFICSKIFGTFRPLITLQYP